MTQESQPLEAPALTETVDEDAAGAQDLESTQDESKPTPVPLTSSEIEDLYLVTSENLPTGKLTGVPVEFGEPEDLKGYRLSSGVLVLTFKTATYPAYDALPEDTRLHLLLRRLHFHSDEVRVKQGREQEVFRYRPVGEEAKITSGWREPHWTSVDSLSSPPKTNDPQADLLALVESQVYSLFHGQGPGFSSEASLAIASVHKKFRLKKAPDWTVAIREWEEKIRVIKLAAREERYRASLERLGLNPS